MPDRKRARIVGKFWELQGSYSAARRYAGQGRARALLTTLRHGWRDKR